MKVLVTGGTGFVGSHTVAALVGGGHDVRLLARSPERVAPHLAPHRVQVADVARGDVTDRAAVRAALDGCDALIHAANVFSFDPADRNVMRRVNTAGTEIAIGEAADRGLDPIVHVSSFVALLPGTGTLTGDSPTGEPAPPYSASKADADRIGRRYQDAGAPVVLTYPGIVWGPHDPYLGESATLARSALAGQARLLNDGPVAISDVRDVAAAHRAILEPGRGPRRYMLVGHSGRFRDVIRRLGEVAGRNLWSIPVPHAMALFAGRSADFARHRFGIDPALSYEGPWLVANGRPADSSKAQAELGIDFTPLETTLRDTVGWLREAGHVKA